MENYSPGIKAAIAGDHQYCHLVHLNLVNGDVRLTDCIFDITTDGETFLGNGMLLGLDKIKETSEVTVGTFKLEMVADPSLIAILLSASQVNRDVTIQRAYLDDEGQIIDQPLTVWSGLLSSFSHSTTDKNDLVQFTIASEWADFKKSIGRRTTTASQHKFFPGDKGLEFAAEAGKEYKWGRK